MTRLSVIVALLLALSATAHGQVKSKGQVVFVRQNDVLAFSVQPGFHFNVQAPQSLTVDEIKTPIAPTLFAAKQLQYPIKDVRKTHALAKFFVCDDALTVCESHEYHLQFAADGIPSLGKPAASAHRKATPTDKLRVNKNGFIQDDFAAALRQANAKRKLIFVDAGASWCPPCMRYESEVFPTNEFRKASRKYVKVRLDVDALVNQDFLKKFGIESYPTLLLLTSTGEEILRIKDFQDGVELNKALRAIAQSPTPGRAQLLQQAEGGNVDAQEKLAILDVQAGRFDSAVQWFQKSGRSSVFSVNAEVGLAKASGSERALRHALEKAIASFPQAYSSFDWREELGKIQNKSELLKANAELLKSYIANPDLLKKVSAAEHAPVEAGTPAALAQSMADIYQELNLTAEERAAREQTLKLLEPLHPSVKTPGLLIMKIYALKGLHRNEEALDWLHRLQRHVPRETSHYQREARLLKSIGRLEEAHSVAQKAYLLSTGLSRIYAGTMLVQIKKDLKMYPEARRILQEVMNSKEANIVRHQRYWKEVEAAQKDLEKAS